MKVFGVWVTTFTRWADTCDALEAAEAACSELKEQHARACLRIKEVKQGVFGSRVLPMLADAQERINDPTSVNIILNAIRAELTIGGHE